MQKEGRPGCCAAPAYLLDSSKGCHPPCRAPAKHATQTLHCTGKQLKPSGVDSLPWGLQRRLRNGECRDPIM